MILAGAVGFEPTNNGVKVRCVTASPYPYICRLMQRRPAKPTCNRLPEQALACRKGISFNAKFNGFLLGAAYQTRTGTTGLEDRSANR